MNFWYIPIGVIALIMLFPYIRCFFKRVICMAKIKRLCRKKRYQLHPTHPLWFLGNRRTQRCDCYIETPNEVFAVKLFGMSRRRTVLIFKENGEYVIRHFLAFLSYGSAIAYPLNSKPKRMPIYDFRFQYKNEWEIKTPRQVLLINPVSMEFRRQPQHGGEIIVGAGDIVNGMEIDSLSRLLSDLENTL